MNKTWLKRTLVGVAASAALLGSLAAYSQGDAPPHDGRFHHGPPSANEIAAREAGFLAYVTKSLSLDAGQAAKLQAVLNVEKAQRAQREATKPAGEPHERAQSLIAGNKFDRAGAQKLLDEHAAQIQRRQAEAPALINAVADFFDSLNPAQQQQVREFAAHHHDFGPGFGFGMGFGPGFGEHHPGEHRPGEGPDHGHDGDHDHKGPPPAASGN